MQAPTESLRTAVYLVFGLFVVLAVAGTAWSGAPTYTSTVTNESMTVDYDELVPVDNVDTSESFYDNETVYAADGSQLTEGTDYTFNASSGYVNWTDTTSTTDGEEAAITYTYDHKSDEGYRWGAPVKAGIGILPILAFAAAAIFVAGLGYFAVSTLSSGLSGRSR